MSGHVRARAHTQIKLYTKGAKEDGALQLKRTQMRLKRRSKREDTVLTVQIPTTYCQERSPKQTVFDRNHDLYTFL